LAVEGSP